VCMCMSGSRQQSRVWWLGSSSSGGSHRGRQRVGVAAGSAFLCVARGCKQQEEARL
jgi:hypothetical protein